MIQQGLLQAISADASLRVPKLALRAQTVGTADLSALPRCIGKDRLNEPLEEISVWTTARKDLPSSDGESEEPVIASVIRLCMAVTIEVDRKPLIW